MERAPCPDVLCGRAGPAPRAAPVTARRAAATRTSVAPVLIGDAIRTGSGTASCASVGERIRADLHLVNARRFFRAILVVEHRAGPRRRPQALALPAGVGIVDAAIHVLGEEAERVGHPQVDELAVDDPQQRFAAVPLPARPAVATPALIQPVHP